MIAALQSTATAPEVLWTTIAIVGMLVAWEGYRRASGDREFARRIGDDGVLQLVTNENVRAEVGRLLVQCICFVLGMIAMATPPRYPAPSMASLGFAVGFILIEGLLVWSSVAALRYKRALVAELLKIENEHRIAAMVGGRRATDEKLPHVPKDLRDTLG